METPMVLLASSYDQSRFFKAADLEDAKKLRIKSFTEESIGIGADKEQKLVLWFTNDEHGLVLNRVNNRTIRNAYGDAVDGWVGKVIVLFPTTAEFRGKMGPALRVRIPPPKAESGNGQPVAAKSKPTADAEFDEKEPVAAAVPKPSLADDLDDELDF
jgi:hypothetical protein